MFPDSYLYLCIQYRGHLMVDGMNIVDFLSVGVFFFTWVAPLVLF